MALSAGAVHHQSSSAGGGLEGVRHTQLGRRLEPPHCLAREPGHHTQLLTPGLHSVLVYPVLGPKGCGQVTPK